MDNVESGDVSSLVDRVRRLLTHGGHMESSKAGAPVAVEEIAPLLAKSLRAEANCGASVRDGAMIETAAVAHVIGRARAALDKISGGARPSNLTDEEVGAFEVIVHTIGRPAIRYCDGAIKTPPNEFGDNSRWYMAVVTARKKINVVSRAVGRIACEQLPIPVLGTGWRVGRDLVVTNRHVAKHLVSNPCEPAQNWKLDPVKAPFVDFAFTDATSGPQKYAVTELVYCAPQDDIDVAILRAVPEAEPLPPSTAIGWDKATLGRNIPDTNETTTFQGHGVYVVGHPYWMQAPSEARAVFGAVDGRKRWSPGDVTEILSAAPCFLHDCSTLFGNSGSCVISLDNHVIVGLHFGGKVYDEVRETGRGSTNVAVALSALTRHPVYGFLGS